MTPLAAHVNGSIRQAVWVLAGAVAMVMLIVCANLSNLLLARSAARQKEMAIRAALGASSRDVQGRIILQTLRLAAVGVALGAAASWLLGRGIGGLLFDVAPGDPATFLGMAAVLLLVALAAAYLPARRASRVDPMVALRAG